MNSDERNQLQSVVKQLLAEPKGLLAADESTKSANKRFETLKIETSAENRRLYRQMLMTTPSFAQYISGVILYDETIRQKLDDGTAFGRYLDKIGVIPGIKVDMGLVDLDNFPGETITEGLDGLAKRFEEYRKMGAKFAKWRSAFVVDGKNGLPSSAAIHSNLNVMARYATIAQSSGIVPIVEPEVLYDGNHSLADCEAAVSHVLRVLFDILGAYKVDLSGTILKTSMVLAGKDQPNSNPDDVAEATLRVLNDRCPHDLGGIVFLSGGQSPSQASKNLNAIGLRGPQPWPITFSFSRAVQEPAMKAWAGKSANIKKAQDEFLTQIKNNSLARNGKLQNSLASEKRVR